MDPKQRTRFDEFLRDVVLPGYVGFCTVFQMGDGRV